MKLISSSHCEDLKKWVGSVYRAENYKPIHMRLKEVMLQQLFSADHHK